MKITMIDLLMRRGNNREMRIHKHSEEEKLISPSPDERPDRLQETAGRRL